MKKILFNSGLLIATLFLFTLTGIAQKPKAAKQLNKIVKQSEVERIEKILSSDAMEGRKIATPGIEKAAKFIAGEFEKIGLEKFNGNKDYLQSFTNKNRSGIEQQLANVVGVLPGKAKKEEIIVISGHYDHLGIRKPVNGDSIYNGANDDAAGITGVILLAKYFKKINNNERTIVFAAFTGEESGGYGSKYFSKQLDPAKVVAMFNLEMIGTESKWGKNSAYITGYEKTNMGEIMKKDLVGTSFNFYPDPYLAQNLFYRSDNATLARLGVPAHTISTSKMDGEPHYHKPSDQVETLDLSNMTEIIKAIALSSRSIIAGTATPSRVKVEDLR